MSTSICYLYTHCIGYLQHFNTDLHSTKRSLADQEEVLILYNCHLSMVQGFPDNFKREIIKYTVLMLNTDHTKNANGSLQFLNYTFNNGDVNLII